MAIAYILSHSTLRVDLMYRTSRKIAAGIF